MSLSIRLGNFLYKKAFFVYKPMYATFKKRQDAFEIELLKKYVKPGAIVLDIGANIGFYASILSELVGEKGQVHCFEPDHTNFRHLVKSCGNVRNIKLNNKAAGSKTEKIKIYTSPNLNVDHRTYEPEHYDSVVEIDAVSMDEYCAEHHIRPDLIKMDIQGYEREALKGMQQILNRSEELIIISEFWPYGLKKAGSGASEYFSVLSDFGFHCYLMQNKQLMVLNRDKVQSMEDLPESDYFNILLSKKHV